jgi:uncharacterized membrane protein YphA (DoxX/SURF4 family)
MTDSRQSTVALGARLLLGLIFVAHGLNGFLKLVPQAPTYVPDRALAFVAALVIAGYVFPLVNAVEIVAGALLLSNRYVPLALAALAPIIVNIAAFYGVLAALPPAGSVLAAVMLGLEIYLAWTNREAFAPMLAPRAS